MQRRRRWRRASRALASAAHLYLGLAAGLVLTIVGLSGSVLVFHDEIDALLTPELHRVEVRDTRASLDRVVAAVRAHRSDVEPSFIRLPREPGQSVEVWTDGEAGPRVYVDPYDARVLGARMPEETLTGWLFVLHVELFAGEFGHWIIGASGFLLLLLAASGLILWWPRTGQWRRALTVRMRGSWRRINYELHGTSGAWMSAGLVVVALTGASLVFHDAFSSALHALTASEPPPAPPASSVRPGMSDASLETALRNAEAALPGGHATWIYLPTEPAAALAVRKQMPGEWHPNGRSYIYLDRHTGSVLAAHDAMRAQLGTRLYDVLYPLHIGRFGLWSKLLYALLGVAPLLLSLGGTYVWWDRRQRRRRMGDRSADCVVGVEVEEAA